MEVHHHAEIQHKKGWKGYLAEFLMIFLAVTMGFFAEKFRENLTNREKEKEYIVRMVNNLADDTTQLSFTIKTQDYIIQQMEGALSIPVTDLNDYQMQDSFYRCFMVFGNWYATFAPNDNTLAQLRNAGGFSIINHEHVLDSIAAYYANFKTIDINQNYYHDAYDNITKLAVKMICYPVRRTENDQTYYSIPDGESEFLYYDRTQLEELYNLIRIQDNCGAYVNLELAQHKQLAARLIAFLKEEYGI